MATKASPELEYLGGPWDGDMGPGESPNVIYLADGSGMRLLRLRCMNSIIGHYINDPTISPPAWRWKREDPDGQ